MKYSSWKNLSVNLCVLSLMIMLTLLYVPQVSAASQPNVVVSSYSIVNGEATVGQDFTLELTLTDVGPSCAMSITTGVQSGEPFVMKGISTVSAGDICYNSSRIVDIPLRIDPTSSGGFYQLNVVSNYEDSLFTQYSSTSTLNILVNGTPDISASIVGTAPVDVYPGDTATLNINIGNYGGFEAQSVNATLSSLGSPDIVKWSGSFAALGNINAKQSKNAQFIIEIPKNVTGNSFPLQLSLQYLDENLVMRTEYFDMNFQTTPRASFETVDAGSASLSPNENSRTVKIMLKNSGTGIANKMRVKIEPQFPFSTDGSVRYISGLAPGQSTPVEFVVDIDKDATIGQYDLKAIVDYEDYQGNSLQDTADLALNLTPKSFFRFVFIDYWFLWLVAIVIASIVFIRKSKSAKKKK